MLPEDGDCTETCRSNLMVRYTIYRTVRLLVLLEFVIQLIMHGMNNMKVRKCCADANKLTIKF
jgi:hypothetical protein